MNQWMVELAPGLTSLVALVDHDGHMTAASEAIDVPQSTMSRRIHALEKSLGVPLVIPDGRGIRLTPTAIRLSGQIRPLFRVAEAAIEEAVGVADPDRGTVRFGFPLTMGAGAVPALLADFARRYPGVRLHLRQAHGQSLIDELRSGTLDLAITIPPPADLPHLVLARQPILAAVASRHPLAEQTSIMLSDLDGEPFIANPSSYNLRRLTEQWCRAAGFEPSIAVEVTEFGTVRDFVSRDLGVALLPRSARPFAGVVEVDLRGDYARDISLTWAGQTQTPVARRLRDYIAGRGISAE